MANVYLHKNKEQRVLNGHPWIFRSDIEKVEGDHADGGVVRVLSSRHKFLGMAIYNSQSQISLRMLSRRDESINSQFIRSRVKRAIDYRRRFADLRSCRLIFAESELFWQISAWEYVIMADNVSVACSLFSVLVARNVIVRIACCCCLYYL